MDVPADLDARLGRPAAGLRAGIQATALRERGHVEASVAGTRDGLRGEMGQMEDRLRAEMGCVRNDLRSDTASGYAQLRGGLGRRFESPALDTRRRFDVVAEGLRSDSRLVADRRLLSLEARVSRLERRPPCRRRRA